MEIPRRSGLLPYAWAVLLVALACGVRALLGPAIGHQQPFVTFFLALIFAAWMWGLGPSLVALLLGAVAGAFLLVDRGSSLLRDLSWLIPSALFLINGGALVAFAAASRRARARLETEMIERRRAEAELRESERRFRQLAETVNDVFWVTELNGPNGLKVLYVSPAYATIWGRPCEALYADPSSWLAAIHPDDRVWVEQVFFDKVLGGGFDETFRIVRPDGSVRWIRDRGFPILDGSGAVTRAAGIAEDVTEPRRLQEELKCRVDELRLADRRKDEFLAMMAHELRNPLAPIRSSIHFLLKGDGDEGEQQQALEILDRQSGRLAHLVSDLLDADRISRGRLELRKVPTDLSDVLKNAAETCRPGIDSRKHEFRIIPPERSIRVDVDPARLEQVVVNLLNNAARYTDPNGRIEVSAGCDADAAVIRVRDNGIGIEPEMLRKIFEPFVQAERRLEGSQGGLGIGLSLVKSLVEMHGGTITASSEGPGRGSEFAVRLPSPLEGCAKISGDETRPAVAAQPRARDLSFPPRHRVLIIDDNEEAADSLAYMLRRIYRQEVRVAYDGASALEAATVFRPDVVLLDIGMPGMDGYEVARRLRRQPGDPISLIVAITGWGQDEDRKRSRDAGFDLHLVKPVEPEVFAGLLGNLAPARADSS